jgi:hypothetical protein
MNLAVGLQPDQQPERRNDHVTVYEGRFAPLTSALALSAIAIGIAQSSRSCAKAGIVGYKQRTRRVKLKLNGAVVAQIPAPPREGTRAEVSSLEASHAKSAKSVL